MKRCLSDMHLRDLTIIFGMTETSAVCLQTATDDPLERKIAIPHHRDRQGIKVRHPETKMGLGSWVFQNASAKWNSDSIRNSATL